MPVEAYYCGKRLSIASELKEPVADMAATQAALVNDGIWLRPFGKLLYTMPTFNCPELTPDHVRKIGEAICKVAATAGNQ